MLNLARHPRNPLFVCRGSDKVPVHARQWFERPGRGDGEPEIWCYTDRLSYAPRETVTVHAISNVEQVEIVVQRETPDPGCVLRRGTRAKWAETSDSASVDGCGWPDVAAFEIKTDWPSGVYRITVTPRSHGVSQAAAHHLFVVRPTPEDRRDRLLLITADCTWSAYNDWGGSNHYEGIVDPDTNRFSPRLSNRRPFARGMVSLPPGAPRTLPADAPPPGTAVSYPHMEWAWHSGYSKKYASAGWASYEKLFVHWAGNRGYQVDVATQQDLHARPEILDGYRCAVMVGHDEYWSWLMRDAVDAYVERGGRVARFAGNFLWQIRLEDGGSTQICHKYRARREDPLFREPDRHLTTSCWEAPEVGRPGHSTFGLDASRGMYAGWGGLVPNGPGGFTVYRPDHWAFESSGLGYGDLLGGRSRIFGYEVDGLPYRIEDGLPFPESCDTVPDDLVIIAMGPARLRESGRGVTDGSLFVGDDDALFLAETLYGRSDEPTLARVDRGSGMVVHFRRGMGEVFHAGTTEWVAGLLRGDTAVEKVTRNVLDRFLS